MSQYNVEASSIIPPAVMSATTRSYAATDRSTGGAPAVGHMEHHIVRKLANRVSTPSWNGELEVRAASTGTYGRAGFMMASAVDRSGTETCTWKPQTFWRSATAPNRSARLS